MSGCGPLAAWFAAWTAGRVDVDQVVDAAGGGVLADGSPLTLALVQLRGAPVRLVLPVAGDVRGLPGPAAFRTCALDLGEALVGDGLALTWQPAPAMSSRPPVWRLHVTDPAPPDPVDLALAQQELTEAVRTTARDLTAAQVAGSSGSAPDLSAARRASQAPDLPPGHPPRAVTLVAQAERLQAVLDLALLDPVGGAVDRMGIAARDAALRPLVTAVRRARLAGYNALADRTAP